MNTNELHHHLHTTHNYTRDGLNQADRDLHHLHQQAHSQPAGSRHAHTAKDVLDDIQHRNGGTSDQAALKRTARALADIYQIGTAKAHQIMRGQQQLLPNQAPIDLTVTDHGPNGTHHWTGRDSMQLCHRIVASQADLNAPADVDTVAAHLVATLHTPAHATQQNDIGKGHLTFNAYGVTWTLRRPPTGNWQLHSHTAPNTTLPWHVDHPHTDDITNAACNHIQPNGDPQHTFHLQVSPHTLDQLADLTGPHYGFDVMDDEITIHHNHETVVAAIHADEPTHHTTYTQLHQLLADVPDRRAHLHHHGPNDATIALADHAHLHLHSDDPTDAHVPDAPDIRRQHPSV